ncbi:MAG: amidohydrolase family protein [Bacteroidota bacterium]
MFHLRPVLFLFLPISLLWGCKPSSFYSLEDFASLQKIDVHVHIRTERMDFAEQAKQHNFQLVNVVVDDQDDWNKLRRRYGYAFTQQTAHPNLIKTITSFSVDGFHEAGWEDQVIAWLDSCFEEGSLGVKVWKNIGMVLKDTNDANVMIDDPRIDRVFRHIEQQQKILMGHLGEPLNCWLPLEEMTTNNNRNYFKNHPEYHMYLHPELPSYQDQMDARDRRLDKHPNIIFLGAHMASIEWNVDTLGAWLDQYPEASIDLAARMSNVFYQTREDRARVRQFFLRYQDRIQYGTDLADRGRSDSEKFATHTYDTWIRDWTFLATDQMMDSHLIEGEFQGIQLPKEVIDKIYYHNAVQMFGF